MRVVEEGRCSRDNALRMLRRWRQMSLRVGADVTLGVAARLQEGLGIDPLELVDREELLWGPPDAARRALAVAQQASLVSEEAHEVMQHEAFQRATLGGVGATILSFDEQGRGVEVCNEAFARLAGGAGWPGRHMQACKMLPSFVAASACAPSDRPSLLQVRWGRFIICARRGECMNE
jgi:hypothetical protein